MCRDVVADRLKSRFTLSHSGDAMHNLANSYSHLGRHHDALEMKEKTLDFRRRVLPDKHPNIGVGHNTCVCH